MKKTNTIFILIVLLAIIAFSIVLRRCSSHRKFIEIETTEEITPTPNIITDIQRMGKWEFFAVRMEELIDTTKGKLFKDQLSAIYTGTLRYGIDFSQVQDDWFTQNGDTVYARLPKVSLLDDYFLDEAATQVVFESGSFTSTDRQDLRERVIKRMLSKSEMAGYSEEAQEFANTQISLFLQQLGIKNIVFLDRQ